MTDGPGHALEDTDSILPEDEEEAQPPVISRNTLIWRRFKRNRLAAISSACIGILYVLSFFSDFFAPYHMDSYHEDYVYCPPQRIRFVANGRLTRPYVYAVVHRYDPKTFQRNYTLSRDQVHRIRFFCQGDEYILWGILRSRLHLFGVDAPATIFVMGTDHFGRDYLSRVLWAGRISLSIGLVGVVVSLFLGLVIGGVSGFYGGSVDLVIQRIVEILQSFPSLPLWMGLSAALPSNWSSVMVYFGIVTILSLLGWTGLAREIRAKILSYKEQDFTVAARAIGVSDLRIIAVHLLPNTASHAIVVATLAIPGMILAESTISFLGLGIKPPMTSWGLLLKEAQNIQTLDSHPWIMIAGLFIIVAVLAFNFLGDGLRDAADPYS